MARFIVERTFPKGLMVPITDEGAAGCAKIVGLNAEYGVTWVHSYVNPDKSKSFCVYDAPSPEAIRQAARCTNLPVDSITQVTALDPYFYH
jgi:hypothetical protein